MSFVNPYPAVEPAGPHLIRLLEPLIYRNDQWSATVPAGFICDGASVPSWAWWLLRCHWIDLLAFGVLHDAFYRDDFELSIGRGSALVPHRKWGDRNACDALGTLGKSEARDARIVYPALRVGGWSSYQKRSMDWGG